MSSGRRITVALVGLVLLVVVGYLVNDLTHHDAPGTPPHPRTTATSTVPASR